MTMLDAALNWAAQGYRVHPCRPGGKEPLLPKWQHFASTDPEQIRQWWAKWPEANVAIATGRSVVVIDCDSRDALAWWIANRDTQGSHVVKTARGWHLYYHCDAAVGNSVSKIAPGVDVRGDGGYVLAPPSIHPSGARYETLVWDPTPLRPLPTGKAGKMALPVGAALQTQVTDLEAVRGLIREYVARHRNTPSRREVVSLLRRVLRGEQLADEGQRDDAVCKVCSVLAHLLPTPIDGIIAVLRPSILLMAPRPEGDWVEGPGGVRDKLERARAHQRREEAETEVLVQSLRSHQQPGAPLPSADTPKAALYDLMTRWSQDGGLRGWKDFVARCSAQVELERLLLAPLAERMIVHHRPDGEILRYQVDAQGQVTASNIPGDTSVVPWIPSVQSVFRDAPLGEPTSTEASRIAKLWLQGARSVPMPEPFQFGGDAYCYKRLPWTPSPGPHPAWDQWDSRLSSPEVWRAFVASVFDAEDRDRLLIWLRDPEGDTGKSTILRVLSSCMGNAAASVSGPMLDTGARFMYASMVGKRLMLYPDCQDPSFATSSFVRAMTSGDVVPVEAKGKQAYAAAIYGKVIVASNLSPELSGSTADRSRIGVIDVRRNEHGPDRRWEQQLLEELPHYLWTCQQDYARLSPQKCRMQTDERMQAATMDCAEETDAPLQEVVEKYFERDPTGTTLASELGRAADLGRVRRRELVRWITREWQLTPCRVDRARALRGIRPRKALAQLLKM